MAKAFDLVHGKTLDRLARPSAMACITWTPHGVHWKSGGSNRLYMVDEGLCGVLLTIVESG